MKIKMLTSYRDFYQPGDIVEEDPAKAKELVDLGRAEYVDIEQEAPLNKEVGKPAVCDCGRGFASERGLKIHQGRAH